MGKRIYNLEQVKKSFEENGYQLLSKEYINNITRLDFICPNNHHGAISWKNFKKGNRCQECYGNKKYDFLKVKKIFEDAKYQLISTEVDYENNKSNLKFICDQGHHGEMRLNGFLTGYRCIECAGLQKYTYEEVKDFFEKEGYELLSTEYQNTGSELAVVCPMEHKYSVRFGSFVRGNRCQECYHVNRTGKDRPLKDQPQHTYDTVKMAFEQRGYKLISEEYINKRSKLKFICPSGHSGEISFNSFNKGHECKKCGYISAGKKISGKNHYCWEEDREALANKKRHIAKCRAALFNTLKAFGIKKKGRTEKLVGYSFEDFTHRMETSFIWESLENRIYSLDHVFPITAFIEIGIKDVKIINSLKNLRPLSRHDNYVKNDECELEDLEMWLGLKGIEPYKTKLGI